MWVEPVTLEGKTLRMEPLGLQHAESLYDAFMMDPTILRYTNLRPEENTPEGWADYMERTLAMPGRVPFAMVRKDTGQAIGSSSYIDIRPEHRGLEIGYTWIGKGYQGTHVNPENKYILIRHAFETLGAIRVQLKADDRNEQSKAAMRKLGLQFEGVLRNQIILPDGFYRASAMFSVIESEWPEFKAALERRIGWTTGW